MVGGGAARHAPSGRHQCVDWLADLREQPGRADERMTGERQLLRRRVDPHHAVVAVDEHGLREPEFERELLSGSGARDGGAVEDDAEWVAVITAVVAEDAQDLDRKSGGGFRHVSSVSAVALGAHTHRLYYDTPRVATDRCYLP